MIHVIPNNDIHEHESTIYCHCKPEIRWGERIVIHNAYDHREVVEIAKEIIGGGFEE